jgi:hypothetical protein
MFRCGDLIYRLEDTGTDWEKILKWFFRKWDWKAWIGLIWLRIGTDGRLL